MQILGTTLNSLNLDSVKVYNNSLSSFDVFGPVHAKVHVCVCGVQCVVDCLCDERDTEEGVDLIFKYSYEIDIIVFIFSDENCKTEKI